MSGRPLSGKVARFALVGVANSLIDLAAFAALVAAMLPPLFANLLAWLIAVSFSYAVNSRWSFERGPGHSHGRSILAFFTTSALISLGVSSGAIVTLAGLIGLFPAKILGICVAAVLSFLAARWSIETLSLRPRGSPLDSEERSCNPSETDHQLPPPPER
jgi:putative flippase GtrA